MKLSILIVNWNGIRYLKECLDSIQARLTGNYEVVLVDNNSTDTSPDLVEREFPWVKLVRSPENLGFTGGNNLAARHASGDILLLLNYDTALLIDPTPFADLLLRDKTVGCIGARMCNGEGQIIANCGHFPSPSRLMLSRSMFWRPYRKSYGPASLHAHLVDWVEASWLLVRRDIWQSVGGFDEQIFMYGEDVDFCKRVGDQGLKVVHLAVLAYRHYVGWSVARSPYLFASFRTFHRKHSTRFQRKIAETILVLGLRFRLLGYGALLLATQQERYKEKMESLRQVRRLWPELTRPGFRIP